MVANRHRFTAELEITQDRFVRATARDASRAMPDIIESRRIERRSPRRASRRRCVALPDAVVSTLAGIYDVMNALALMRPVERAGARAVPRRDRGRGGRPAGAGQRRADPGAARDRHHRGERHRDRAVGAAAPGGLAEGPLSAPGRLAAAHARARRGAVLGLLGDLPAGRDGPVRRQGRHRALRLRAAVRGRVSGRADSSRARARDLGRCARSWSARAHRRPGTTWCCT